MENLKGRQLKTAVRDALTNEDWQTIIYTLIEEYGTKFGVLTMWGDAAKCVNDVEIDGVYIGEFGLKSFDK